MIDQAFELAVATAQLVADPDDVVHVQALERAEQFRSLSVQAAALLTRMTVCAEAGDLDGMRAAFEEHGKVSAQMSALARRGEYVTAALREGPSTAQ